MMIVIKVLIFCFNFSGMAVDDVQASTGRKSMLNSCKNILHNTAANEAVIQPKKPKDVAQSGDLSVLVEIGREILVLLKCILALVLLVVVGIVYIVAMLS